MLDPAATAAILGPPALPFSCCSGISPPQPSQHGMGFGYCHLVPSVKFKLGIGFNLISWCYMILYHVLWHVVSVLIGLSVPVCYSHSSSCTLKNSQALGHPGAPWHQARRLLPSQIFAAKRVPAILHPETWWISRHFLVGSVIALYLSAGSVQYFNMWHLLRLCHGMQGVPNQQFHQLSNPPTPNPREPFKETLKGLDDQNQVPATFPSFKRYLWKNATSFQRSTCPATETIPASLLWFLGTASKANSGIKRVFATWEYDLNCLIQSIRNRLPNYTSSKLMQPDDTYFNMFQYFRLHKGSISLFQPTPSSFWLALSGHLPRVSEEVFKREACAESMAEMRFLIHGRLWWKVMKSWCFYRSISDSSSQNCWDRLQPCIGKPLVKRFFITVKASNLGRLVWLVEILLKKAKLR